MSEDLRKRVVRWATNYTEMDCNRFDAEHSHIAYTLYMEDLYGREKIEELQRASRKLKRWRAGELLEIEEHYKQKLGELIDGHC